MSAVYSEELKRMVQQYIDDNREVVDKLRNVLESTSVDIRYSLIKDVRGVRWSGNVLHESAYRKDVEMMKRLLHEFSSDQMWQVLRMGAGYGSTPLHWAAFLGSTDAAKYLLESTPQQFRYEYLEMKDVVGDTALHWAAYYNHLQIVQVLLSFLPPQQQLSLLKVTNNENQSVTDLLFSEYPQGKIIIYTHLLDISYNNETFNVHMNIMIFSFKNNNTMLTTQIVSNTCLP